MLPRMPCQMWEVSCLTGPGPGPMGKNIQCGCLARLAMAWLGFALAIWFSWRMRLATRSSFISCSIALRDVSNQTQQTTRVTRERLERRESGREGTARTEGASSVDPYARQARPGQLCALFTFRIARCFYSITSGKFCHFVQCLQVAAMCPSQLLAAFILFCFVIWD